ncbi:MAG: YfbM family protein [Candidatus Obscuribacterales bacterium]|nr:YfbM family protein [Candidatus Obscuribacterales bacterium]
MSGRGELFAIATEDAEKLSQAFNKHGDAIRVKRQKIDELNLKIKDADDKIAILGPEPDRSELGYYDSEHYKLTSKRMDWDSKIFDLEESLEDKEEKQANAVRRAHTALTKKYKTSLHLDKAWDGIHRCLSGTQEFDDPTGDQPLSHCILGGTDLDVDDLVIRLVDLPKVHEVAEHLSWVTEDWFRSRYLWLAEPDFMSRFTHDDDDFNYHWSCIPYIQEFYRKAAEQEMLVLFSGDV